MSFAGQDFVALADRALFWPRHRALIVADLHLEKASWFATRGQPLPPYDSLATLDRLAALASALDAAAIWCLGDSFHDPAAAERVAPPTRERLGALAQRWAVTWVAGNHDGITGGAWGGTVTDAMHIDAIVLRHAARPDERRAEISGHFHPKLRVAGAIRSISRPCFATDGRRLILPAFGSLTGGLDARDPAIAGFFPAGHTAVVVAAGRLLHFAQPAKAATDATASP